MQCLFAKLAWRIFHVTETDFRPVQWQILKVVLQIYFDLSIFHYRRKQAPSTTD